VSWAEKKIFRANKNNDRLTYLKLDVAKCDIKFNLAYYINSCNEVDNYTEEDL